jgi:acyl-CoA hydrolase
MDTCDLVPNTFSEVPALMRGATKCSLVLAAASPLDRQGYFSPGAHADYAAVLIGERTRKLISIAHPKFRDELERQAREMDYL